MADVHELAAFRFRPGFGPDRQFETMRELEPLMTAQPGLILREYFYSDRDRSWVTHLVWADEDSVDAAGPRMEADPAAMSLLERFDPESMRYARYELAGRAEGTDPGGIGA
jgi:hypothetical protein